MKGNLPIIRMMGKITIYTFVLTTVLFNVLFANKGHSQITSVREARISIDIVNQSLNEALDIIERNSEYHFIYVKSELKTNSRIPINASVRNETIETLLLQISKQADVAFRQVNNQISVRNNQAHNNLSRIEIVIAQTVTGKITDETGNPLPGATVLEKGTTNGTTTDVEGKFQLNVNEDANLSISFVGYTTVEVAVNNRSVIDVQLSVDSEQLEEVVVVGYGSVKKSDLTGSVSSIKSDLVKIQPVASFDQGLVGLAPGLQVVQGGGAPGAGTTIRIRGGNSLLGGNEPLYVIDGFPIYSDISSSTPRGGAGGGITSSNPLSSINPNDIASIEILKDASATAIYGSRGANGVIIITTKLGDRGKMKVNYDGYYGVQEVLKKIDLMNGEQMAAFHNLYSANEGRVPYFDGVNGPLPEDIGEGTDWQDVIFEPAPIQNHNLSVSGGNENTLYSLSLNYFDQQGIVKNTGYKRGSIRLNIDQNVSDRIKIGARVLNSRNERIGDQGETTFGGARGAIHAALSFFPSLPIYREDGTYSETSDIPFFVSGMENPLRIVNEWQDNTISDKFLGNVYGEIELFEGLKFKSSLGANNLVSDRNIYLPRTTRDARDVRGYATQSKVRVSSYVTENLLSFDKTIAGIHAINAVGGFTYQQEVQSSLFSHVSGFVSDFFGSNFLDAGDNPSPPSSSKSKWQLASWLGRVNYGLMDRYLITFTARADGSSKFGANNRWAFFPSGAIAWKIKEEAFMSNVSFIDDLKARVSYGLTGNSEIGSYQSLSRLATTDYAFNNTLAIGFVPQNIPNPDLKWETTSVFDVGLDFGILNNRLRFNLDYYYKKTTDLLLNRSIRTSSGYSSALENRGIIENKGIELNIEAVVFDNREFTWSMSGNFSANRNKILDLGESEAFTTGFVTDPGIIKSSEGSYVKVGEPVGAYLVLINDGIFQNQEQLDAGPILTGSHDLGYPRYIDTNNDGLITDDDRQVFGDPNPDFIFGINNQLNYKGFNLGFQIEGQMGYYVLNLLRARGARVRPNETQLIEMANYWTPENTNTDVPKAENTGFERFSSRNFEDGSHWRIRNVTLGYNIPVEKAEFIQSARVYLSVQNLALFTNYTGYDPNVNSGSDSGGVQDNFNRATDRAAYPSARTYSIGVNLSF